MNVASLNTVTWQNSAWNNAASSDKTAVAKSTEASQPHDTVKLTQGQQVSSLYRSGESVSSISSSLGISKSTVNDYLGLIEETAIQVPAGGGSGGGTSSASSSSSSSSAATSSSSTATTTTTATAAATDTSVDTSTDVSADSSQAVVAATLDVMA